MLRDDPPPAQSFGVKASEAQKTVRMAGKLLGRNSRRGKKNKGKSSRLLRDGPGIWPDEIELEDLEDLTPKEEQT